MLGSCTTAEEIEVEGDSTATFGDAVNFTSSVTRVSESNTWEDNDAVGIYCGDYYSNINYTVSASGVTMEPTNDDVIYYVTDELVDYYAYYPYREDLTDAFAVDLSDQSDLTALYLLYDKVSSTESSVDFVFEHQLSKVSFEFKSDYGFNSNSIKLRLSNVGVTSNFDLKNGEFSSTELGEILTEATIESGASSCTIETMMLPMATLSDLKVEFLYNGTWWGADLRNYDAKSWEAGKEYEYTITAVDSADMEIETIIIWGDTSYIYCNGVDGSTTLTTEILPVQAASRELVWESSDPDVAKVEDGVVYGISVGTVTITATSTDAGAVSAEYEISVFESSISVGDYLYSDGTYGVYPYDSSEKTLLGVVYRVDNDNVGAEAGMITHISEAPSLAWATSNTTMLIKNNELYSDYSWDNTYSLSTEGLAMEVMQEAYRVDNAFAGFPAFKWIAALNATTVNYDEIDPDEKGVWYMPGEGCLKLTILPTISSNPVINDRITAAGGSAYEFDGQTGVNYLSASENPGNSAQYRRVAYNSSTSESELNGFSKSSEVQSYRTRAIMEFDLSTSDN